MPQIRPISDLRNKFTEISQIVHERREPVFLTKNGSGDMVVMSIEDYEERRFLHSVEEKLLEAREEALSIEERRPHDEVMARMRRMIADASRAV